MATSGTVSTTVFDTRQVIDHALRRCRLPTPTITPEMQQIARDNLFLLLSALANQGLPLWCIEKEIYPLATGMTTITCPVGTIDLLNFNLRNLQRLEGTYATSAGGTAANAFDDDYSTSCTQVSTNGNISIQLEAETQVSSWGLLANGDLTTALSFDRSTDGVTWTTVETYASATYSDEVWHWFDLDPTPFDVWFRVRATGGGTLNLREFYVGNSPNEVPMYRFNRDDFFNQNNKAMVGQPLQFWFDRQRDQPVMWLWPAVSDAYREYQVVVNRTRYIQDVGTLRQQLDIPQRWYESIVWMLAWRCAMEIPEVDKAIVPALKAMNDEQEMKVRSEERDNSTIRWTPDISAYSYTGSR
jgi:hypothetical protein